MRTVQLDAKPIFELTGRAGRIDLSAWISGLSYATGAALASGGLADAIISGTPLIWLLPATYLAFLLSVLVIQRHMRLSLTASTFGKPQALVTSGIFRYSRNPIYVAFLLPLASLAVLSLPAAAAAIAVYVLSMNLTIIRSEERDLAAKFGGAFSAYALSTPRWIL